MDNPGSVPTKNFRLQGGRRSRQQKQPLPPQYGYGQGPQFFDDTTNIYPNLQFQGQPPGPATGWNNQTFGQPSFPGQQILGDPMAAMAMQYGQTLAGQGKVIVNEKLEKFVSVSKLKYYFAVDTAYVAKKLGLIFFPFTHSDWSVHYNQEEPVAPRYDINAPDLYIPSMAFVTYILTAGYLLGTQNKFSPEQLGIHASSALAWLTIELAIILLALYVLNIGNSLKVLDLTAFCSYKYVCMIAAVLASLIFSSLGYFAVLCYCSLSLDFFLLRTLRVSLLSQSTSDHYGGGSRRSLYLLLVLCVVQPFIMYWLTRHLVLDVGVQSNVME
ncbi:protein YIF1B-B-like isoform X2 [Limulus polyphemus]|uniref:Protein YIF1 n=1 Tax=Limulus polyphemus TaxID=6850 RepID=A0ABM1BA38_LIMPO|nr:protein YIF1B-B-like isoform X2 [Limulus polyphemus]XP_013777878.1 protein YIF1B-B-like isoform X2 [Limulus polyphemus]XP_022245479.1 protein YIF1B-B-like isoform X2 [Limulus polyphemus]